MTDNPPKVNVKTSAERVSGVSHAANYISVSDGHLRVAQLSTPNEPVAIYAPGQWLSATVIDN